LRYQIRIGQHGFTSIEDFWKALKAFSSKIRNQLVIGSTQEEEEND
jgi:hypothetical protein